MRVMIFLVLGLSIIVLSCKKETVIDTTSDTISDPFADITFLDSAFYTTNYDNSMKAGPQIFLFRISGDGKYPENKFSLNMNGQGYFAITNDGQNLYLQSRNFNSVMKCSPVGEIFYNQWFIGPSQRQGCGIGYVSTVDSLCMLTRDQSDLNHYELLYIDKNNPANWQLKASAEIQALSKTMGAYAVEVKENRLYILGQDTTDMDVLIKATLSLDSLEFNNLATDSTTGLCFKGNDLYVAYLNRDICKYTP